MSYVDHGHRHRPGGSDPIIDEWPTGGGGMVQPWLVLHSDNGATTTSGVFSRFAYQSWARMNDAASEYLYADPQDGATRFRACITKQGVYLIELNCIWGSEITTGETFLSLDSAAGAGLVSWETVSDRFTELFSETGFQQTLFTMFHKYTDSDCFIDPKAKQNTGGAVDVSSAHLKIVRLTDAGPFGDWEEGSV